MRTILGFFRRLFLGIAIILATTAGNKTTAQNPDLIRGIPDLLAFWDFSEAAGELRRSEVGGRVFDLHEGAGAVQRITEGPLSGYSARFTGSQYLHIPRANVGDLNLHGEDAEVTVVAWIKWQRNSNADFLGGIWNEGQAKRQYGLFLDLPMYGGDDQVCGHISAGGGPTPGYPYSRDYSANRSPVPSGVWSTVALSYDGTYIRSYLNAMLEPRPTYTDVQGQTYPKNPYYYPDGIYNGGPTGGDFTVGAVWLSGGMGNFLQGDLGGLAVFNRALTPHEMLLVHLAGVPDGEAAVRFAFSHYSGSNQAPAVFNWRAFDTPTVDGSNSSGAGWLVANLPGVGTANGYLAKTTTGQPGIAWNELGMPLDSRWIEQLRFTLNNANEADMLHVALQIGGQWYASAETFRVTGNGRVAADWSQAETKTFQFRHDAADWRVLTFDAQSSLALGAALAEDLPMGMIEAIGFYQPANLGTLRIDDFEVFFNASVVPEPATMLMLPTGFAFLAMLLMRRRKHRPA